MSTPSSPSGSSPSGGDQHPGSANGWGDPAADGDPWSSPPPAAQQAPHDAFPPPAPAWGSPPQHPAAQHPWPAPSWEQSSPQQAPRRPGRAARRLAAGSAVLVLGVAGGFAGALLQERSGGARTYPSVSIPSPAAGSTARPPGSVAGIAAAALPSVVALQVQGRAGRGTGSGFVLQAAAPDGGAFVLTNDHVVSGAFDDGVTVVFEDGQQVPGDVVGADASYDLAVVRVEREGLTALRLGDSAAVVVGDPVVAVGAPLGLQGTVTEGIVSALNRPVSAGETDASYLQAIQTDAAINPGNSGGPLLNGAGEVIGINSAIASVPGAAEAGGSIGLGFSIPAEQARRTAEQLIRTGRAVHPVIRVSLDNSYDGEGVQVLDQPDAVEPGGPADRAGLRPGDVVLAVDGRPVTEPAELIVDIRAREPGDTVTLTLRRGNQTSEVPVTLASDG